MASLYELRRSLGLLGLRQKFGLVRSEPTALDLAVAAVSVAHTTGQPADVTPHVERIIAMYRRAAADFPGYGDSMWSEINSLAAPLHTLLMEGAVEAVAEALNHPNRTNLFLGFDNPVVAPWGYGFAERNLLSNEVGPGADRRIYLAIRRLAEATGATKIANPETLSGDLLSPDQYLDRIDAQLGVKLAFPNFYPGEEGLQTSRGIISYRPLQAIYQAWRLRELGAKKVVEIGAGLGRTAFYARSLGIEQYTIIDIPLSRVAQSHFLGRALGVDQIGLAADEQRPVRILGPDFTQTTPETFDVVMNVDSLSEMDLSFATQYVSFARRTAPTFLSINREWDGAPRTADLLTGVRVSRYPYWMRDGYVEELARFPSAGDVK